MNLVDKNVLVIGAARSGIAAARVAKKFGAHVTLSDAKKNLDVQIAGVNIQLGEQSTEFL